MVVAFLRARFVRSSSPLVVSSSSQAKIEGRNQASSTTLFPLFPEALLIEALHANVPVTDRALRIVALQRESPLVQFAFEVPAGLGAGRLGVLEDALAIHDDRNAAAFDDDLLGPPFLVLRRRSADVNQAIKAAGLDPVTVRIVDLALEPALRPAFRLVLVWK